MTIQEQYADVVERFKALTELRNNTKLGEAHNKLTVRRNVLRKELLAIRAQLPGQIVPDEALILQQNAILGPETDERKNIGMMQ